MVSARNPYRNQPLPLRHCQQEPLELLQGLAEIKHVYLDRQKSDL